MRSFLVALTLWVLTVTTASAEISITNLMVNDVARTYGFSIGQQYSLEQIKKEYPSLDKSAQLAESEFSAAFGDSLEEIDKQMSKFSQADWSKLKANLDSEIAKVAKDNEISFAEAKEFIRTVNKRAKGDIPSPILETLLIFKPLYQESPEMEFLTGYKQRYKNDGKGKAKGVKFNLELPKSWKEEETKRPNVAAKFLSENGRGLESFMVLVNRLPLKPGEVISKAEVAEFYTPKEVKESLPPGSTYIASGAYALEQQPGFWARYDMTEARGRLTFHVSVISYFIFYENHMLLLQGQVAALEGERNEVEIRFKKHEKLFEQIANSLVLPALYHY